MKFTATVTVEGQSPVLVETRPVDIMQWEAAGKRKITDGLGYSDMLQIIHGAAKRQGLTDRPFSDWAASLEDFDPVVPDGVDPTKVGQPTTE